MIYYKMFGLIKKAFFVGLTYLASVNSLSCISMTNWEFKVRPEIVNVISNEPVFYPFCIKQVNVVVGVTTSMIHMQKYVFLTQKKFKC